MKDAIKIAKTIMRAILSDIEQFNQFLEKIKLS
jgi:hypothetical protein